ncbi:MAG: IS66 family transposase [Rhodanobacteraceae bacterium]|nr:IS66 family transposase [Rhodanobacteraceae bacterium]
MVLASTDVVPRADYEAALARAESAEARLAALEQQLAALKRQRFGASSENADQLTMFGNADIELIEQEIRSEQPVTPKKTVTERQRLVLPKGLPEERVEVDLPESEKVAADGAPLKRIGEEVTVKLCFKPAVFFKKLIVRPKYADPRQPEAGVRCARLPAQLIDGSHLDASLGAHLLVSKYADHLPLFRIEEIYSRGGVAIPRSTLSDWVIALSGWLKPLVLRLHAALMQQKVIHVDETVLPLQSVGRTISARAWAYVGRDPAIVVYDFTVDKAGQHVRDFLRSWKGGWLQADAASNYDELYRQRPEILEVGCWAHARRKFFEIAALADKSGHRVLAHEAVERIGELFAIERAASEAGESPPERGKRRQQEARPILEALRSWCEDSLRELLPKSPTALAIGYTLKHWDALTRYLDDGAVAIDNNAAERALREIAVGRKNWLFAGSERGGEACAIVTSLIETAKAHGRDPVAYLTDVLERLPTTLNREIDALLPMSWAPRSG